MRRAAYIALLFLAGCNAHHAVDLSLCSGGGASSGQVETFKSTVYQATARCASCHANTQSPMFRAPDVSVAFQNALSKITGATPILVTRSGDGHCGQDACRGNNADIAEAVKQMQSSAGFGAGCGGNEPTTTKKNDLMSETGRLTLGPIPIGDLSNTTFTVKAVSVPTTATVAEVLRPAQLLFSVRRHSSDGYCVMKNIAALSPATHLRVQRIYLVLNGQVSTEYVNYADQERSVRMTMTPAPATPPVLFPFSQVFRCTPTDTIGLTAVLTPRDDPGASVTETRETPLEMFVRVVRPELERPHLLGAPLFDTPTYRRCVDCHNYNHPKFKMYGEPGNATARPSDQVLFDRVRAKANPTNPQASILTIRPGSLDDFHYFPYKYPKQWANPELLNEMYVWIQRLAELP